MLTLILFITVYNHERHRLQLEFNIMAGERASLVIGDFREAEEALKYIRDFYAASHRVDRDEFTKFTRNILIKYPDLASLYWVPRVLDSERIVFEERTRQEGYADFSIYQFGNNARKITVNKRLEYFPFYYIAPLIEETKIIFGYDAGSVPEYLKVMQDASDSGETYATEQIEKIINPSDEYSYYVFFPVYRQGFNFSTVLERRNNLTGFLALLYYPSRIGLCLSELKSSDINLYIYDESAKPSERLVFVYKENADSSTRIQWSKRFDAFGRKWRFVCIPTKYFFSMHNSIFAWFILGAGILVSGLLKIYLATVLSRKAHVELLVKERTKELEKEKQAVVKLASFPELNPNPVLEIDLTGRLPYVNPAAKHIFPDIEKIGVNHPFLKGINLIIEDVVGGKKGMIQREVNVDEVYYEQVITYVSMTNALRLYSINITDRKQSEEALRLMAKEWDETFNSITDMISVQSKDYKIIRVNKAYAKTFGVDPQEIVGKLCCGVVHSLDKPHPNCPCPETITNKSTAVREIFEPHLGLSLEISTSPVINQKGEVEAIVHVMKDISKHKEIERLKDEFISTVSHELRTPLAIVKEGVGLIIDRITGETNPKQQKILVAVEENIFRLAKIIDGLLDFSKIQSGAMGIDKKQINLLETIRHIMASFENRAIQKGLGLKLNSASEEINIYADRDKIVGIFTNLIDNALKFTQKGNIEISVQDLGNGIRCVVSDTGIGIAQADLPKVFGKFQQFSRPAAGSGAKGTGLGLAITKSLVEMHNGKITVESQLDKGTKFIIILPK